MRKFMFLFRGGGIVVQPPPPPAEIGAHLAKWTDWVGGLVKAGHVEVGPPPLENGGKVVRGSARAVTDGPYAEAKGPRLRDPGHLGELARGGGGAGARLPDLRVRWQRWMIAQAFCVARPSGLRASAETGATGSR